MTAGAEAAATGVEAAGVAGACGCPSEIWETTGADGLAAGADGAGADGAGAGADGAGAEEAAAGADGAGAGALEDQTFQLDAGDEAATGIDGLAADGEDGAGAGADGAGACGCPSEI